MERTSKEFKWMIYDLMNGLMVAEECDEGVRKLVKNEFEEGSRCERLMEDVSRASHRICQRLGVEEDQDLSLIVTSLMQMGEYLGMKMYDYGVMMTKETGDHHI